MLDSLIKKLLPHNNAADDLIKSGSLPSGRPERFATIGGMFGDLHEHYGYSNLVPLEQAKALFTDVPPEVLANYSDETLRRMAFNAELLARQYVLGNSTGESVESVTRRFALHALERKEENRAKVTESVKE